MTSIRRIGRRTWLGHLAGGFVGLWAGLASERGRDSWAGWLSWAPSRANAQGRRAETIPIEIELEFQGNPLPVAAFLVIRGQEIAIVDTLVPGNADRIGEMIQQAGLDWRAVRHIILTHWHFDHAGSAAEIAGRAPSATIWAGEPDIPQISLPRSIAPAHDGDEVFGLRILATPGHTAGHISVLDTEGSALMTGDALINIGGELAFTPPEFTEDMADAIESVRRLGTLGFDRALFAHGTPIPTGASSAFARLAATGAEAPDPYALVDPRHNCLLHA